jgi:hypothetical protein
MYEKTVGASAPMARAILMNTMTSNHKVAVAGVRLREVVGRIVLGVDQVADHLVDFRCLETGEAEIGDESMAMTRVCFEPDFDAALRWPPTRSRIARGGLVLDP